MSDFKEICLLTNSTNPYEILLELMRQPETPMHGPVHHILDGAAFLTAMHNAGAEFDLDAALDELAARGAQMPGATYGKWGVNRRENFFEKGLDKLQNPWYNKCTL